MNVRESIDFKGLADSLLSDAEGLLAQWFPNGVLAGHEFKVGDLDGSEGDSLSVNVNTGKWADFASGEKGGDLISLYAAAHKGRLETVLRERGWTVKPGDVQAEAARELQGQAAMRPVAGPTRPKAARKAPAWTPVLPVPENAPAAPDRFARNEGTTKAPKWVDGRFVRRWTYTDAEGRLLGHVARFEWTEASGEIVKDVVPQTWCVDADGNHKWRTRSFPVPRPLYGLRELAERPDAPVIVVEGEKSADAAREIAPQYVVVAWPGGIEAWRKAALNPLRGRSVLLWPDADEPGTKGMWEVGHALLKLCPTVKIILPAGKPDGWDAADALAEGWGWQAFKSWALPLVKLVTETGDGNVTRGSDARADHEGSVRGRGAGDAARGVDGEHDRPADQQASEPGVPAQAAPAHVVAGDDGDGRGDRGARAGDHGGAPDDRGSAARSRSARAGDRADAPARSDAGVRALVAADAHGADGADRGHDAAVQGAPAGREGAQGAAQAGGQGAVVGSAGASGGASQVSRWLEWGLDRNGNGAPLSNLNNAVAILEHDQRLQGLVWFDEFLQRMQTGDPAREWTRADDINLALYMQRAIGIQKMSVDAVAQAVQAIAYRNVRNCAKDWMSSLKWDRTDRIEMFMCDVFGAEDNAYVRAVSRNFWISIVARVFDPGCQVDNMVVLEGLQGKGKSSAVQIIAGEWYAAQHESPSNMRAFAEVLQGKIIAEIEEMHAFSRSETEAVKKAVTVRKDRFRPSGAHGYAKDHPRTCIFVGTTNRDDWNKDETGARRFWPIRCTGVELDLVRAQREQYFAEAVARYKAGEPWWQTPEEQTKAEQAERYDADPWLDTIAKFVSQVPSITVAEVMEEALKIEIARFTRADQMRVAGCLRMLGWQQKNARRGNRIVKLWRKPVDEDATGAEVATGRNAQVVDSEIPF